MRKEESSAGFGPSFAYSAQLAVSHSLAGFRAQSTPGVHGGGAAAGAACTQFGPLHGSDGADTARTQPELPQSSAGAPHPAPSQAGATFGADAL